MDDGGLLIRNSVGNNINFTQILTPPKKLYNYVASAIRQIKGKKIQRKEIKLKLSLITDVINENP